MSELYFAVLYDISRPYNERYRELLKKESRNELTRQEALELVFKRRQLRVIERFVSELEKYGWRLTSSVFVVPEKYRKKVEEVVNRTKGELSALRVPHEIYILDFRPSSNPTISGIVRKGLTSKVRKLAKLKDKKEAERRFEHLLRVAEIFGLEEEVKKLWR